MQIWETAHNLAPQTAKNMSQQKVGYNNGCMLPYVHLQYTVRVSVDYFSVRIVSVAPFNTFN